MKSATRLTRRPGGREPCAAEDIEAWVDSVELQVYIEEFVGYGTAFIVFNLS